MNERTFPVPEDEAEKLEQVEETLAQQRVVNKVDDAIRANPWPYVGAAAVLGFVCRAALSRR